MGISYFGTDKGIPILTLFFPMSVPRVERVFSRSRIVPDPEDLFHRIQTLSDRQAMLWTVHPAASEGIRSIAFRHPATKVPTGTMRTGGVTRMTTWRESWDNRADNSRRSRTIFETTAKPARRRRIRKLIFITTPLPSLTERSLEGFSPLVRRVSSNAEVLAPEASQGEETWSHL